MGPAFKEISSQLALIFNDFDRFFKYGAIIISTKIKIITHREASAINLKQENKNFIMMVLPSN